MNKDLQKGSDVESEVDSDEEPELEGSPEEPRPNLN